MKERKIILNAKAKSIMNCGALLFEGETQEVRKIYHTGVMAVNRAIKDKWVFKESCESICSIIGVDLPSEELTKITIMFAHKVISRNAPEPIIKTLRHALHPRTCHDIMSNLEA